MSAFDVWLWLKLDDVRDACGIVFFVFGCLGIIPSIILRAEGVKLWPTRLFALAVIGWLCGAAFVLTPSTKQAAAIYVVPRLVESRAFTNDIPQLYGMAIDALKEKLAVEVSK